MALLFLVVGFYPANNTKSMNELSEGKPSAVEASHKSAPKASVPEKPAKKVTAESLKKINPSKLITRKPARLTHNTQIGVYTGPGTLATHTSFEQWLGRSVPVTTDYIDYKGGWQKDFIDSQLWLAQPWGKWAKKTPNSRLVLGVPMLESQNTAQFSQGANGAFDVYFRSLAENLVKNGLGDSVIRLGYEANCNTIGPWQATDNPAGYIKLYRHEVGVMSSVPGAAFAYDWTVCNGLQNGHALNTFDSFYPGNDVVDIVGMDIYDVKWMDPGATPQQRWDYAYSRRLGIGEFLQFAASHGKAVSYPEWGLYRPGDNFAGGGDNPYFINKMDELIKSTNPVYQSYFNLNWGGGVLEDFIQSKGLFKQLFGA